MSETTLTYNDPTLWSKNSTFSNSASAGSTYNTVMKPSDSGDRIVTTNPIRNPATTFTIKLNTGFDVAITGFRGDKKYYGGNSNGYILSWTSVGSGGTTVSTLAPYLGIVLRKSDTSVALLPEDVASAGFVIEYENSENVIISDLTLFGLEYPDTAGFKVKDENENYLIYDTGGGNSVLGTKTITENGTYSAMTYNYDGFSSVSVNVSGGGTGVDIPTFTRTYDSEWEEVLSITCDKTLNECFEYYENHENAALLLETNGDEVYYIGMYAYTATETGGVGVTNVTYVVGPDASEDIVYTSEGIENQEPSEYPDELTVTDDGTYAANTVYKTVDVAIDYVSKTYPITIVNHSSEIVSVMYFLNNSVVSSGYISHLTIGMSANSTTTRRMPKGSSLLAMVKASSAVYNFELQINSAVVTPDAEYTKSNNHYKLYTVSSSTFGVEGTTLDIYDTAEPWPVDIVAEPLSVTVNGTYTAPSGTAYTPVTVDVQSNDFIVTLSYDSTSEMWEPDCTYAELMVAYTAEKNIIFVTDDPGNALAEFYSYNTITTDFNYFVNAYDENGNLTYYLYAIPANNSIFITDSYTYYDTQDATAVAAHVKNGDTFYTSTGKVTGSATARSSTDLTASGDTVTAPAGYYAEAASKSVSSGSATTPATTITANPSISVNNSGLITASVSGSQNVTPTVSAGYVSTGTSGTITVSGSTTSQLSTVAGSTITPTESQQTAVAAGKYTTGAINVAAISSTYVGSGITRRTSSDLTVSGASVTTPAGYYSSAASTSVASGTAGTPTAAKGTVSNHSISVTPSVTNTTGYITGSTKTGTAVTVSASELVSGSETKTANGTYDVTNLASLVVAVPIVTYYTGSSAPSSSLGSNGDIYLQTS